MSAEEADPHDLPIEGELDLHTFRPQEAADVVEAFLEESVERDWSEVRIVHGKGIGTLRKLVHTRLKKLPYVVSFRLADGASGSWGATWVTLKKKKAK